ncbi:MAG: PIG-L family deacetylase [Candidatus Omnitrophica bacterium]|nr:PIG-L family deacetylase [Candidatus Omnitrophota bacterium]
MRKEPIETKPEFRRHEKIPVTILESYEMVSKAVASEIADRIQKNNAKEKKTVLALDTGNTLAGVYREWIQSFRRGEIDFSRVILFAIAEYHPIEKDALQSQQRFLKENLLDHVNLPSENTFFLDVDGSKKQVEKQLREYEKRISDEGGIDIALAELGSTGHIGFNQPGTQASSRTRQIALDEALRKEAAADFFSEENVPESGVTLGLGTLLEANSVILVAIGEGKSKIVRKTVEGDLEPSIPATNFQGHEPAHLYIDHGAAESLIRVRQPWVLGDLAWGEHRKYRAVIQLSEETGTALSRLETIDFTRNHLAGLLRVSDSADSLCEWVADELTSRIRDTGDFFEKKKVLIFSPHPDDDVICMGGTMQKLLARKNRVDVAYMTSGCVAVFDEDALRHLEFIERIRESLGVSDKRVTGRISELMDFLKKKKIGQIDSAGIQAIKRIIRESEAVAAIETLGIGREHAHFLDLPFYQTGRVKKDPIGDEDVKIVLNLLRNLKPDIIFVAGDMTDPHGTHRMCKQAIDQALLHLKKRPEVWLYRGAWQEWDLPVVDVFVPVTKAEMKRKRLSIFKHESQKDRAVFPGPSDSREFWQRAEERNTGTALALDRLGLQEYFALEAFVFET